MKKLLILYFLLALSLPVLAQQPLLLQERNYNIKPVSTQLLTSAPDKQGNVLFSGISYLSTNRFAHSLLLIKPNADSLWMQTSPITLGGDPQALKTLPDGNFIFGGIIPNNNTVGISLQKWKASGQLSWSRSYLSVPSAISTILPLPNKDYLMGVGWGFNNSFAFLRTDSLGNIQWNKSYVWSQNYDAVMDMQFTPNGRIIASGMTGGSISNTWHLKLLLLNQNGDSLRGGHIMVRGLTRREGTYYNFSSVTPLSDGGFLLTGNTDTVNATYPNGSYMGMVVKVDSMFNVQWKYVHRNQQVDEYVFTKAKELSDGSILVLGFQFRPTQGGNGFQLYRFGLNGQLINVYPFTSSICSQVWGVTLDHLSDSTYLVGGRCGNNPPITYGFYVAKVKIPGLPLPLPPYTVTGTKAELAANGTNLGQSYPNPAASAAIIPYTLPQHYNKASILIREIATGREIRRYELKRGHSSLNVELGNLSNGLYLYSLVVDEKPVATKKLAVMK